MTSIVAHKQRNNNAAAIPAEQKKQDSEKKLAVAKMENGKQAAEKKQACKFFMRGSCRKGHDCPFSHDLTLISSLKQQKSKNRDDDEEEADDSDDEDMDDAPVAGKQQAQAARAVAAADDDDDEEMDDDDDDVDDEYFLKNKDKEGFDVRFLSVLDMLKRNDPKLLQVKKPLFADESSDAGSLHDKSFDAKSEDEDFARDDMSDEDGEDAESNLKRQQLVQRLFGPSNEGDDSDEDLNDPESLKRAQQRAKREFEAAAAAMSDEEEECDDDWFKPKAKSEKQLQKEAKEMQKFAQEQERIAKEETAREAANSVLGGRSGRSLNPEDQFLQDYILNNGWVSEKRSGEEIPSEEQLEDEERELELLEEYQDKVFASGLSLGTTATPGLSAVPPRQLIAEYSEREKKISKRKLRRQRQAEKGKQNRLAVEQQFEQKQQIVQRQIKQLLALLKPLVRGNGSAVDRLPQDPETWDWDKHIETNAIVEELMYADLDGEFDPEEEARDLFGPTRSDEEELAEPDYASLRNAQAIRKILRRKFEYFYNKLSHEDLIGGLETATRFKYRRVDKQNYGELDAADILGMDEDVLDDIVPHELTYDEAMARARGEKVRRHGLSAVQARQKELGKLAKAKRKSRLESSEQTAAAPVKAKQQKSKQLDKLERIKQELFGLSKGEPESSKSKKKTTPLASKLSSIAKKIKEHNAAQEQANEKAAVAPQPVANQAPKEQQSKKRKRPEQEEKSTLQQKPAQTADSRSFFDLQEQEKPSKKARVADEGKPAVPISKPKAAEQAPVPVTPVSVPSPAATATAVQVATQAPAKQLDAVKEGYSADAQGKKKKKRGSRGKKKKGIAADADGDADDE